MKKLIFYFLMVFISIHTQGQVPVSVNRSTITAAQPVSLPSFSASGATSIGLGHGSLYTLASTGVGASDSSTITSASGIVSASPGSFSMGGGDNANFSPVFITVSPIVTFATNAPAIFTNSISGSAGWSGGTGGVGFGSSQTYIFNVVENGGGGGGSSSVPLGTLTGLGDSLESISRKNTSSAERKLLGFQLKATTNATLTTLTVQLSNTTTNNVAGNNFSAINLYRDADGGLDFDSGDTLLATTTNASGFAVFASLVQSLITTNKTFFVTANFMPTNQTKNSFITASLKSQTVLMNVTNGLIETTGGTIVGKQYAFLDNTQDEDDVAALVLANQINSAVSGATNSFRASASSEKKSGLIDSIAPAAAAGAAGVGAAFTSDSVSQLPLSQEFTRPK